MNQIWNVNACGMVYLVGAGPGDPDLLTVRALRLIQRADVIAYDKLVPESILALASPDAERLDVGRRCGCGVVDYRVHPEVVVRAEEGKSIVRLKAGDPMIFGRGAEEAEELVERGIPFEIVPGISAALGAASSAGIPLTHRDHASDVTFATGHDVNGVHKSRTDWGKIASSSGTLVLYMVGRQVAANMGRLIAQGRSADTPAAYIACAARPNQRVITGTLATLPRLIRHCDSSDPALLIIGDVVRVREKLARLTDAAGAVAIGL